MKTLTLLFNNGRGLTTAGFNKNKSLAKEAEELRARGAKHLGYGEYDVTGIFSPEEEARWKQKCRDHQRTYAWKERE